MIEVRVGSRWHPLTVDGAVPAGESARLLFRGLPDAAALRVGPAWVPVADGQAQLHVLQSDLNGLIGRAAVTCDGVKVGELEIVPEKISDEAFARLRADLQATWVGLVYLEASDGTLALPGDPSSSTPVDKEVRDDDVAVAAADVWHRIARAVTSISTDPHTRLVARVELAPKATRPRGVPVSAGAAWAWRLGQPGPVRRLSPSVDIEENRMVVDTLARLAALAAREDPLGSTATLIQTRLRERPWCDVPRTRGPFRPTHIVRRDGRYRQIYEARRAIDRPEAVVTEGPAELRLGLRALPRLYEYWVFLQVLRAAIEHYGPPDTDLRALAVPQQGRLLLELRPGTEVRFPGGVVIAFEPRIDSAGLGWQGLELVPSADERFQSMVATPDVVVLRRAPAPAALVIDAKYIARGWVERDAATIHAKYSRMRLNGVPVVREVLAAHPHAGLENRWAGYGYLPFVPGDDRPAIPWI